MGFIRLEVLNKAMEYYLKYWGNSNDVSEQTKKAQLVGKEWQASLSSSIFRTEVKISKDANEKIDVLDISENTAYELKVSGKNISHELFKDIYKVMTYNLNNDESIDKLVFISEWKYIDKMERQLDKKYLRMLEEKHCLSIYFFSLPSKEMLSSLLLQPPERSGLRGDQFLWIELLKKLSAEAIPDSDEKLLAIVHKQLEEILGEEIKSEKEYFRESLNFGGMSGGMVSGEYWLKTGIPYILEKYSIYKQNH